MFDRQRTRKDILALWQIASYSDSRIEPVACGEREYEEDAGRMIIEIARREGIKIALEEET
jgi:hypothetical protein